MELQDSPVLLIPQDWRASAESPDQCGCELPVLRAGFTQHLRGGNDTLNFLAELTFAFSFS